jgi:hypothetical protein
VLLRATRLTSSCMTTLKTCSTCHLDQPETAFAIKGVNKRHARCKSCKNERTREGYVLVRSKRHDEIHARNRALKQERTPLMQATRARISCSHCQSTSVSTPSLADAARNQVSTSRWLEAITHVAWICRRCKRSGVADNSIITVMNDALKTLMPVHELMQAVRAVRPATNTELAEAYIELTSKSSCWEPLPGWVQRGE